MTLFLPYIIQYSENLLSLFFPSICQSCDTALATGEKIICIKCLYELPKTNFHETGDNPVAKHFWGRVKIENAAAYYHFANGSRVQHLIHRLKYSGKTDVGLMLGRMYGAELAKAEGFNDIDIIVPVPLHPKKEQKRGYNQSAYFAMGLAESLNKYCEPRALKRSMHSDSQTQKNRLERWENVRDAFEVAQPAKIKGKHILLTDDVITTGATLEACAAKITEAGGRVSIAAMACAGLSI